MSDATRATLDAAIRAHANAEWDGDLPVDWVMVAGLISPDGTHTAGLAVSRENIPLYVTVGLLHEGIRASGLRNE